MRNLVLIAAVMLVAACAQAQQPSENAGAVPEGVVAVEDGKVTLTLKDAPVVSALDQLFKGAGKAYIVDPMTRLYMDEHKLIATVRVENAPFDQALSALLKAAGLAREVEDGTYLIVTDEDYWEDYQPGGLGGLAAYVESGLRSRETAPVTLRLPAMPVKEAYEAVIKASGKPDSLGWQFKDDLANTMMPGASFKWIPVKMAAAIVVAAAGLVPPSGSETLISKKGSVDFTLLATADWEPPYALVPQGPSIAAYEGAGDVWRFFINARSTPVPDVIRALLSEHGSYLVEDRSETGDTFLFKGIDVGAKAVRVSVRLINVTLDQALNTLNTILGPNGFTYRVENGVYIVQQKGRSSDDRATGAKPKAGSKIPAEDQTRR